MTETIVAAGDALPAGAAERIAAALALGELIVYPTDTFYAIGGLARDSRAALRVRAVKGREEQKPLPVVAADVAQARALCATFPDIAERLAGRFWPGPLSLVLPAARDLPQQLHAGTHTVAVRVPARLLTCALAALAGPLVSTSANRAGEPPGRTLAAALASVGGNAEIGIDGGEASVTRPSTLVDLTGPAPLLIRAGALAWQDVTSFLASGASC